MTPFSNANTEDYLGIVLDPDASQDDRNDAASLLITRLTPMIRASLAKHGFLANIDDVVQDLCLQIVNHRLKYDPSRGRFRDLVAVWANRWGLNRHRIQQRHRGADVGAADSDLADRLVEEPDRACQDFSNLLSDLIDNELRAMFRQVVLKALSELNERDKIIVELYLAKVEQSKIATRAELKTIVVPPAELKTSDVYHIVDEFRKRVKQLFGNADAASFGNS